MTFACLSLCLFFVRDTSEQFQRLLRLLTWIVHVVTSVNSLNMLSVCVLQERKQRFHQLGPVSIILRSFRGAFHFQ